MMLATAAAQTSSHYPTRDRPTVRSNQFRTSPKNNQTEPNQGPILVSTDLISLTVSVTDSSGHSISGLKQDAFTVFDEKQPQQITFFSDDDAPVSIGILFDLTGSMSGAKIRRATTALSYFFETSDNQDEYFLITLQNGRAFLSMDSTRDSKAVLDKLSLVEPKGNTALFDGARLAVEKVERGIHPKRALLIISDGEDNNSRYTLKDIRNLLKESDVSIYCIGIEESGYGKLALSGSNTLDEMARISGGQAFFPRGKAEMDDSFVHIANELRHQYSIGYKPNNFKSDGSWHRVKVKVNGQRGLPKLFVRTREGYFAVDEAR